MRPILSLQLSVTRGCTPVLCDVKLDIQPGEIIGIIGRSGSGKSTLATAILGLLRGQSIVSGHILYDGRDLLKCTERELRAIRGKEIALVLQAAASALNPWLRIEQQFEEAWYAHASRSWAEHKQDIFRLLSDFQLEATDGFLRRYPRQISIGQAQRVLIAMALLHNPRVLILDEPTSALDCIARAEVHNIIGRITRRRNVAIVYISHDLAAVAGICERIGVLDAGRLVEVGKTRQVLRSPEHSATMALANAFHADRSGTSATPGPDALHFI
jgi:ABC-type glutathione transport system ATPase component